MSNPAYPSLFVSKESHRSRRDGRSEDVLGDGSARVRKLFADKFDFAIVHPSIDNSTDLATLRTFIAAHETDDIDFTWVDGNVYVVRIGKGGLDEQPVNGARTTVRVRLVGA